MPQLTPLEFQPTPELKSLDAIREGFGALSPRSCEVVAFMASGFDIPEIADSLYMSRETVKSNARLISEKLDTRSDINTLTIGAHASGWFNDVGSAIVADQPATYTSDSFREGFRLLTPVPREVLGMRASGFSSKQVALSTSRSINTIRIHEGTIRRELLRDCAQPYSMHKAIAAIWLEQLIQIQEPIAVESQAAL